METKKATKSRRTGRATGSSSVERLPEPARSLGRDVRESIARRGRGTRVASRESQTGEQMEEWIATRAPGARRVRH
jgi:hypothetical protein